VLGASSGLVALLAHSFFDFNMHIPANAFLAVTLLALIASHMRFATERYWLTARWPWALAGTVVILGCLWYLVPQAVTRTRETALLRRAAGFKDGADEKIALLRQAFEIQPTNFETAFAVGEQLRALAVTGDDGHRERAMEAAAWFERAIALNKWDVMSRLHLGMCLDWAGEYERATPYFQKAIELDPNHWYSRGMMGWHEFQQEHYQEAAEWFLKSRTVNWVNNPLANTYSPICEKMLRTAPAPQ
jgi:tetratricopeptide (TPR) repeat protein